jgi:hypothetical protein
MEQKKFPIKRAEIIKLLNGITSKNFKIVISHAQKYLLDVRELMMFFKACVITIFV